MTGRSGFTGPDEVHRASATRTTPEASPVPRARRTVHHDIYTVPLPPADAPVSAVYNVGGLMSAGNVVNAIPQEVTFSVDLRTVDPELLLELDAAIVRKCEAAAAAHKVSFTREWIQRSEAGGRPEQLTDVARIPSCRRRSTYFGTSGSTADGSRGGGQRFDRCERRRVQGIPSIAVGRARGGDQQRCRNGATLSRRKSGQSRSSSSLGTGRASVRRPIRSSHRAQARGGRKRPPPTARPVRRGRFHSLLDRQPGDEVAQRLFRGRRDLISYGSIRCPGAEIVSRTWMGATSCSRTFTGTRLSASQDRRTHRGCRGEFLTPKLRAGALDQSGELSH